MGDQESDWVLTATRSNRHHFSISRRGESVLDSIKFLATCIEELENVDIADIAFSRHWTREYGDLEEETTITVYFR
jgi:hypothetical protein